MGPENVLLKQALALKASDRFMLVDALLVSLDAPNGEVSDEWIKEAERRLSAYKEGKLETVSFDDMFNKGAA